LVNIIVVFPKLQDAKNIRNLLVRSGYPVLSVCSTGAQVLTYAEELNDGIVVCGYRYPDMMYTELREYLPEGFDMLLLASKGNWSETDGSVMCVEMPLKIHDLLSTISMMVEAVERRKRKKRLEPKQRSDGEKQVIDQAKLLLVERNNMTEEDAHRYLQKTSMDSGTNIVETAQMILSLYS